MVELAAYDQHPAPAEAAGHEEDPPAEESPAVSELSKNMEDLVRSVAAMQRREYLRESSQSQQKGFLDETTKAISRSYRFLLALSLHSLFEFVIKYHVESRDADEFSVRVLYVIGLAVAAWAVTSWLA